jgi:hypothetical protein
LTKVLKTYAGESLFKKKVAGKTEYLPAEK